MEALESDKRVTGNDGEATVIRGAQGAGDGAVRCVYLTNGATVIGFTLTNGATRNSSDDRDGSGAGVWCESPNAIIANCALIGNSAYEHGAGAYGGTLSDCILSGNRAIYGAGGAFSSTLNRCVLVGNSTFYDGGGANRCTLKNCVLIRNAAFGSVEYSIGGGVAALFSAP